MNPNPRDTAVWALADREGNVTRRLESLLGGVSMPASDQALARELALGTHRRRATLDAVLRGFMERPEHRPPGALGNILAVAAYQILFLDRIPQHAAVYEAVEQA